MCEVQVLLIVMYSIHRSATLGLGGLKVCAFIKNSVLHLVEQMSSQSCGFLCNSHKTTISVPDMDKANISPKLGVCLLFEIQILVALL